MTVHSTFDRVRAPSSTRSNWLSARKAETGYASRLRKIAQHVGEIVNGFDPNDFHGMVFLQSALEQYARALDPWARAVGQRMVTEVAARDRQQWMKVSAQMGRALHLEIDKAPTGEVLRRRMEEQVSLIKSIPADAAKRVHELAIEGISNGTRASEIAKEIVRSGEVSKGRATLIARTEVSRTATELTAARAQFVGSTSFIWRTAKDSDVRPTHKVLEGKVFEWSDPPECDPGYNALPGGIWNCRCYPEVILTDAADHGSRFRAFAA